MARSRATYTRWAQRNGLLGRSSSPTPPDAPITIEQLLDAARAGLRRLTPHEACAASRHDAQLIDMRSDSQRARDGVVPGARYIPRNVLEWRLDPASAWCVPGLARPDVRIVLICDAGYQSSLAAATLQRFGLRHATDVIGGFQAWRAAGLPVHRPRSVRF